MTECVPLPREPDTKGVSDFMKPPVFRPLVVGVVAAAVLMGAALAGSHARRPAGGGSSPAAGAPVLPVPGASVTSGPTASPSMLSVSPSTQSSESPTSVASSSPAPKPTYVSLPPLAFDSGGPPAVLDAESAQALEPETGAYTSGWRGAIDQHLYIALVGSPVGNDTEGLATVKDLSLQDRVERHLSAGAIGTLHVVSADNATGILDLQSSSGRTLQLDVVHMRFLP